MGFNLNLQDKEVDCGGAPPRVLVLDDYFMTEVEKVEKDPDTGKRVKRKVSVPGLRAGRKSSLTPFETRLDLGGGGVSVPK